jgi:uncharacterized protein
VRVRGYASATPCWAELASTDPASAVDFYHQLFGWRATTVDAGTTIFTLRDLAVAGLTRARKRSAWRAYISTENMTATVAAVTAAGGEVLRPPADTDGRGQGALVADAEGAAFGLWQRGTFAGAQVISERDATCWSEVASRDPARATAFYGQVFGWVDRPGAMPTTYEYREWQVGNRVVGGLIPMTGDYFPAEIPPHWRVTVEVDRCDETASGCASLGGHVFLGPIDIGIGQFAQLFDPQGAPLGVIEPLPELRVTP